MANEIPKMTKDVILEWLVINGKLVAPKTLLQQIMLTDGTKFEDKYHQDMTNVSQKIKDELAKITSFEYKIVDVLPTTGEKGILYLILSKETDPALKSENNVYDEYLWINNKFEFLGNTKIDLSGYTKVEDTDKLRKDLELVQKEVTNLHPNSWEAVSTNIKLGLRNELYPLGKQFVETHKEHGDIKWEVNDYDHRKAADGIESPNMTLEMVNCIYGYMVDQYEFLHGVEGQEMPAGTYHFHATKPYEESASKPCGGNKDYQFTLSKPIPIGGGISLNWGYQKDIVTAKVDTYTDQWKKTKIESTTLSLGTGGTNLGTTDGTTLNHIDRIHFGNNNAAQSALIQYLNGTGKDWWHPTSKWDTAPSYVDKDGFLGGFSQDFIDSIVPTKHVVATNTVCETDGYTKNSSYEITCKMFPMSMTELGLGANNGVQEGVVLDKYKNAIQADRIKTDKSGTARYWWLISPNPWNSSSVRGVFPSGALNGSLAYNGIGFVAACTIQ